jgi:hypothetical protein
MKLVNTVVIKATNDIEAVIEARKALYESIVKHPLCKHVVKVELSNGKIFEMWANPRFE